MKLETPTRTPSRPSFPGRLFSLARDALAVVVVAVGAALFALAFRWGFDWVFRVLYRAPNLLAAFSELPAWLRIALPCAGGAVAGGLSMAASRFGGAYGVGGVMEVMVLQGRRISLRGTILKALGSWCAIVTGGSVGREGPIIQFGGGLGAAIGRAFRLSTGGTQSVVAAGTAAGFAAAYNTPLAAMLIVFEIITGTITLEIVPRVALATAIATAVSRSVIGGGPIYGSRAFTLVSDIELGAHAALGLLGGIAGVLFMMLLSFGERSFERIRSPRLVRTALGGLGVGLITLELPAVTGNGFEAIGLLLDGRLALASVGVLLVAKAIATTSSVGSGTPGGVFTPSLFLGAALGAGFGRVAAFVLGSAHVGASGGYALVGMAAVVAATTHAPMMAAVLAFELSGDYAIALPLLIATGTSSILARSLRRDSIYTAELRRIGLSVKTTLTGRKLWWSEADEVRPGEDI